MNLKSLVDNSARDFLFVISHPLGIISNNIFDIHFDYFLFFRDMRMRLIIG